MSEASWLQESSILIAGFSGTINPLANKCRLLWFFFFLPCTQILFVFRVQTGPEIQMLETFAIPCLTPT